MNLFARIQLHSNRLTSSQKRIVEFLQASAGEALTLPINKLAERCQVGDATIIRFYRLLGYDNYSMFRIALSGETGKKEVRPIYEDVVSQDGLAAIIHKVIHSSMQGIADLEQQLSQAALERIADKLSQAAFIHVIGLGASGVVAQDVMHKLMRLGLRINAYTDSHLMTIAATVAQPQEVFFAVCHSGETTDIIRTLELAQAQGCYTCALTGYMNSSITRLAGDHLLSCTRETKMRSDAMISRIVQLVVIDILYVRLALQIGEEATDRVNHSRIALKQLRGGAGSKKLIQN